MRPIIAASLVCLLLVPVAFAVGPKAIPKTTPKRTLKQSLSGPTAYGGSAYHPLTNGRMHYSSNVPYNFSATSGIGLAQRYGGIGSAHHPLTNGRMHLSALHSFGMLHGPMFPAANPWWFLNERRLLEPANPLDLLENPDLDALLFPNQLLLPQILGHSAFTSPKHPLIRQMIRPSESAIFGLANEDLHFFFARGGRMGMPYGLASPYGLGSPSGLIPFGGSRHSLLSPYAGSFFPPTLDPDRMMRSYGMGSSGNIFHPAINFGVPSYPFLPGRGIGAPRGTPYLSAPRPRVIGKATQPAPKPVAAKPLTKEEKGVLKSFETELAGVLEAARKKNWNKLDISIRKVQAIPDLPDTLSRELKEMDTAAKEMVAGQWLADVVKGCAALESGYARQQKSGIAKLGILSMVNTLVAPEISGRLECRAFDLQVLTADVERLQKLVVRLAEDVPPKKESDATAAEVEKLLGRSVSGVETLLWLHMREDQRSAQEVATELRKTR